MLAVVGNAPASPAPIIDQSSIKPTPIGGGTGRIAFATFGKNQIYTINADGTELIHLTDILTEPQRLQWSPDGTHLAFSTFGVESEIYVMNADGSGVTHLANTMGFGNFTWSPDSRRIVYDSRKESFDNAQIYTMNIDGTGLIQLTSEPGSHESPAWSSDGKRIAFQFTKDRLTGPREIHVMNADGSGEIKLADGWSSQNLLWSPDGTRILYVSASNNELQIYVVNADGSQRLQLTNTPGPNLLGGWSPDGKRIAFTSNRDGRNSKIYVMNADGSEPKRLTNDPDTGDGYAEWSPDGKWITYTSTRIKPEANCCTSCCVTVYMMKADGSGQRKLTSEIDSTWTATWQP